MDIEKVKIKMGKKQKLMIFSVICFFAALIGTTYAWIAHDFLGSSNPMAITSIGISLSYRGTSQQILADLAPGESITKTFSVTNTSNDDLTYDLYWLVIDNTFVNLNYLMYTLEEETEGLVVSPRYLPATNNKYILYYMTIPPNETHDYTLTLTYVEDPVNDQGANQDKYFIGDIAISQEDQNTNAIVTTYVDEEYIDIEDIEDLTDYTIDENRTYCTDGSSISIVSGEFSIYAPTNSTNCVVYLNSVSFTPTYTDQERYNYLYLNLNGGEISTDVSGHYQEGDVITTATPTKSGGYSFVRWAVSGNDSSASGTTITMGTTYTEAKAIWSDEYQLTSTYSCADDNTSGLLNTGLPTSMKYNTTTQLPTPTKTRYAFVRWDVTGTGSSIDANNVLTMGTADTTVNAVFTRTEWTKVTKTCVADFASYARTYKVCDRTFANYTKQTNYCGRSAWRWTRTKYTCSTCLTTTKCAFSSQSVYYYGTSACGSSGSAAGCQSPCSVGCTYYTSCSSPVYIYDFEGTATTTESSCTSNTFECNSDTYQSTKVACTTNYNYEFGNTQNDTQTSCTVNSFTCDSSTYTNQRTDSCTIQYNYGFNSANTTVSTCTVGSSFTCNSGTVGNTYVSACQ